MIFKVLSLYIAGLAVNASPVTPVYPCHSILESIVKWDEMYGVDALKEFKKDDHDGNGFISFDEALEGWKEVMKEFLTPEQTEASAEVLVSRMFANYDRDPEDDRLNFEEYVCANVNFRFYDFYMEIHNIYNADQDETKESF